jgi:hypothetical protein
MNDLENYKNLLIFLDRVKVKGRKEVTAYKNAEVFLLTKISEINEAKALEGRKKLIDEIEKS